MPSAIANTRRRYRVLGVNIDAVTLGEAAKDICERSQQAGAVYVTKPYVEFIDRAVKNSAIRDLLNDGWMCLPDGVSLQWATSYLYGGKPGAWRAFTLAASIVVAPNRVQNILPERFSGATFTWELLKRAAETGCSVYFMGNPIDSSIEHTVQVIKRELPNIKIVGSRAGSLEGLSGHELLAALQTNQDVASDLVAGLQQLKPNLVLLGLGFPIQEQLMARIVGQLDQGVLIGEGGTFDYDSFGGKRRRAPAWMRKLGIEWLWRLILEPKRWRRQLAIPKFMWNVYRDSRRRPKNYSQ